MLRENDSKMENMYNINKPLSKENDVIQELEERTSRPPHLHLTGIESQV